MLRIPCSMFVAFFAATLISACDDRSIESETSQDPGAVAFRLSESDLALLDPETDSVKLSATRMGFRLRSAAGPVGQLLSLADLEPGVWNLQAMVYDSGARPLWRGDTSVRIIPSTTARSVIRLIPVRGSAVIDPVFDSTFGVFAWAKGIHYENIPGNGPSLRYHRRSVDMDSNGLVTTYEYSVPSFEEVFDTFQLSPERLDSVRRYLAIPQIVNGGGTASDCTPHPNFDGWEASIGYSNSRQVSVRIAPNSLCVTSAPGAAEIRSAISFLGTRNPLVPLDLGGQ